MKASSNVQTLVPTDFQGFLYQMKAYLALVRFITGDNSLPSLQLNNLVRLIEKYSANYKIKIAKDKCFAGKFENVVNSRFHLFLQDCRKSLNRDAANTRLISFRDVHEDVILQKFNVQSLLACFSLTSLTIDEARKSGRADPTPKVPKNPKIQLMTTRITAKEKGKEAMTTKTINPRRKHSGWSKIGSKLEEFKMRDGEIWEQFQGKCIEFCVKFKDI